MIFINGRFLTQPMTGVNRYAYNICKALTASQHSFTLVCPKKKFQDCYDTSNFHIIRFGFGNSHFWEQCVLPFFFLGKRNYILLSFTGLGSVFVRRKIMTIHDLAFLESPSWYSRSYYLYYKLLTTIAVRTSRHVITVSEFSKSEILRFYPFLRPDKISVVYGAADNIIHRYEQHQERAPRESFALSVSSIDPRKNFARLVEAFKDIKNAKLYIVGNYNRVFRQQEGLSADTDSVKFLGRLSDDELIRLYNEASCFVFPSVYEGFGLPPIEAMTCGCPVMCSDIPVLREVCGDAALYFDPLSTKSIHDTIEYFFDHESTMRAKLQAKGYQNATRFSFEKSAEIVLQLASEHIS